MKITRLKAGRHSHYFIDGKFVSYDTLNEICQKFLTAEGLMAMWRKLTKDGECTLELDIAVNFDEESIIESKNAELEQKSAVIAALEKKLMQFRIKAAKYDGLMAVMKTACKEKDLWKIRFKFSKIRNLETYTVTSTQRGRHILTPKMFHVA